MVEAAKRAAVASELTDAQLNFFSGVFGKAVGTVRAAQDRGSKA